MGDIQPLQVTKRIAKRQDNILFQDRDSIFSHLREDRHGGSNVDKLTKRMQTFKAQIESNIRQVRDQIEMQIDESNRKHEKNFNSKLNEALTARDDKMVKLEHSLNKAVIDLKNWLLERINVLETKHSNSSDPEANQISANIQQDRNNNGVSPASQLPEPSPQPSRP